MLDYQILDSYFVTIFFSLLSIRPLSSSTLAEPFVKIKTIKKCKFSSIFVTHLHFQSESLSLALSLSLSFSLLTHTRVLSMSGCDRSSKMARVIPQLLLSHCGTWIQYFAC